MIVVATDEGGLASPPQTITVTLEDALAPTINAVAGAVTTTAPGGGAPTATMWDCRRKCNCLWVYGDMKQMCTGR